MRTTLTIMNFKNKLFNSRKAFHLKFLFYKSIINMLDTNKVFKNLSLKYKDVDRYFTYFKECSYLRINHVYYSREIKKKFSINSKYKHFTHFIAKRLKRGKGIEDYLSGDAHKLHRDMLYLDMSIIHVHFDNYALLTGNNKKPRSHMLLLLRVQGRNVYMIDIVEDISKNFLSQRYLQIMYNNWPDTLVSLTKLQKQMKIHLTHISSSSVGLYRKYGVNRPYFVKDEKGHEKLVLSPGGAFNAPRSINMFNSIDMLPVFLFNIVYLNARYFDEDIVPGYFKFEPENESFKFIRKSDNRLILSFNSRYFLNIVLRTSNLRENIVIKVLLNE